MDRERTVDYVGWLVAQVIGVILGFAIGTDYGTAVGIFVAAIIIALSDIHYELTRIRALTNNHDM